MLLYWGTPVVSITFFTLPYTTLSQAAIQLMDQKLCDKFKRLNALHHQTEVRKKRLEELEAEYKQKAEGEEAKPGKEDSSVQAEQVRSDSSIMIRKDSLILGFRVQAPGPVLSAFQNEIFVFV